MRFPESFEIESLTSAFASGVAHSPPELGILDEGVERGGEAFRVTRFDEKAGLALDDELGDAADMGSDHRQSGGHRLEHRDRQTFRGAREHEDVRAGEQLPDVLAFSEQDHALADPERFDRGFQLGSIGSVADDRGIEGVPRQQREGPHERQEVLWRFQPSDGDDEGTRAFAPRRRSPVDVDRVRDHDCRFRGARLRGEPPCAVGVGDADRRRRQGSHQAIRPAVQTRGDARVCGERPAVHREDSNRDAGQGSGQATENPSLRAVGMDDVRPFAAQHANQLEQAGHVAEGTDLSPDVFERDKTGPRGSRRSLPEGARPVRRHDDVEPGCERGEQRGDVGLGPADFGERDQQQHPRPPRIRA